jgi:hypothetical protein
LNWPNKLQEDLSYEDQKLLEEIAALSQQLDIENLHVREIKWAGSTGSAINRKLQFVPSEWCYLQGHKIIMPQQLQGKLTVEE